MLHGDPWSRWQIMKEATPSKKSSQVSSDMRWHTGAYYSIMYSLLLVESRKVMCRCNHRISDLEENRRARDATGLGWFNDSNLQSGITSICQYLVGDKYMWHDRGRKLRTLQLKHIPDGQDQPRPTWLVLLRLQRWRSLGMFRTSEMSRVCFAKWMWTCVNVSITGIAGIIWPTLAQLRIGGLRGLALLGKMC